MPVVETTGLTPKPCPERAKNIKKGHTNIKPYPLAGWGWEPLLLSNGRLLVALKII